MSIQRIAGQRPQLAGSRVLSSDSSVDIIVCVHNALPDVIQCLQSVLAARTDHADQRIIVVDDGSSPDTADYLRGMTKHPLLSVYRNESAGGYTKAVNLGLSRSRADIAVLLNSDTMVPFGWIEKLRSVFERYPDIGIVSPLSNAASWQSVPRVIDDAGKFAINELPEGFTVSDFDRALATAVKGIGLPRVQLLNGFCLMMRRAVVESIGTFDEQRFPRGYGEENDFCFRASDAGFGLMIAIDTYVYHAKSKSYGSETRAKLAAAGGKAFREKYGSRRIERAVSSMRENPTLRLVRERISDLLAAVSTEGRRAS